MRFRRRSAHGNVGNRTNLHMANPFGPSWLGYGKGSRASDALAYPYRRADNRKKMTDSNVGVRAICFEEQAVCLRVNQRRAWHIELPDVGVIGEYTTDHGPLQDDWFVVFVRRDGR